MTAELNQYLGELKVSWREKSENRSELYFQSCFMAVELSLRLLGMFQSSNNSAEQTKKTLEHLIEQLEITDLLLEKEHYDFKEFYSKERAFFAENWWNLAKIDNSYAKYIEKITEQVFIIFIKLDVRTGLENQLNEIRQAYNIYPIISPAKGFLPYQELIHPEKLSLLSKLGNEPDLVNNLHEISSCWAYLAVRMSNLQNKIYLSETL